MSVYPATDTPVVVELIGDMETIHSEVVHLTNGRAQLHFPFRPDFKDDITIGAHLRPHGDEDEAVYAARTVIFPRKRELQLDVADLQPFYRPGAEVETMLTARTSDGRTTESALGVVIFDRAVEERARTDRDFGSGRGFYGAYRATFDGNNFAGISRRDLDQLDFTQPIPEDLQLVAAIIARNSYGYSPTTFDGTSYDTGFAYRFKDFTARQFKAVTNVLPAATATDAAHPRDEATLRTQLARGGINPDTLLDPWARNYETRFTIEGEHDVLTFISGGADKTFDTADDYTAARFRWRYFPPTGKRINEIVAAHHERTGGFLRDAAALRAELSRANFNSSELLDRWGTPYDLRFDVSGASYVVSIVSAGANRRFESPGAYPFDDFTIWQTFTEYFTESRARLDRALRNYSTQTKTFPQTEAAFRDALARAGITDADLQDGYGRTLYTVFKQESRFTDRVRMNAHARYANPSSNADANGKSVANNTTAPQQRIHITPVTQQVAIINLRSNGADATPNTSDDFDLATFLHVFGEQSAADKSLRPSPAPPLVTTGASGAILGIILDPQGAVIPGVKVTAKHATSGATHEAMSSDEGAYILANLPVGFYQIEFAGAGGFSNLIVEDVPVTSSNTTQLDVTLTPNGTSETVTVTAEANSMQTESSVVTTRQVTELPLNGRKLENFLVLNPAKPGTAALAATPRLREYFPETLLWQPDLETDSQGTARVRFKLADNITTWKMAVIGSTADGTIGTAEREITAFQPFFVEHDPPPTLTAGDRIWLPVVIRNYLDRAAHVNVAMQPEDWFTLANPAAQRIQVAAGDAERATFDLRAIKITDGGKQRVTALSLAANDAETQDAIERRISVRPDGEEIARTASRILNRSAALDLDIPANAIPDTARAELKIYPNLTAHLAEAIEGIMQRPYGCAEQTISAAYPSLMALRLRDAETSSHANSDAKSDANPPPASPTIAKAERYLRAGVEKLLGYRNTDGGFSFWGNGASDTALTAYALQFLTDAAPFTTVDGTVTADARKFLIRRQQPDGHWQTTTHEARDTADRRGANLLTALVARALAETAPPRKQAPKAPETSASETPASQTPVNETRVDKDAREAADALNRALAFLDARSTETDEPYMLATYALASFATGDSKRALTATARLQRLARDEAQGSYWSLRTNTPFYGWGIAGRIETTALAVQALTRSSRPDDPDTRRLIERATLFLLANKDRYGVWHSTQASVRTLDALLGVLGQKNQNVAPQTTTDAHTDDAEIFVNGVRAGRLQLKTNTSNGVTPNSRAQLLNPLTFDLTPHLRPGSNLVELRRANGTRSAASAQIVSTYFAPWANSTAALASDTTAPTNSLTSSATNPATTSRRSDALALDVTFERTTARVMEEITCRVSTERIGFRGYGMMLAEIGLPPGADVDRASLEQALQDSASAIGSYEVLPDRLRVYLWSRAGGSRFAFKFRPRFALDAQSTRSVLYDYYNPEESRATVRPVRFVVD